MPVKLKTYAIQPVLTAAFGTANEYEFSKLLDCGAVVAMEFKTVGLEFGVLDRERP